MFTPANQTDINFVRFTGTNTEEFFCCLKEKDSTAKMFISEIYRRSMHIHPFIQLYLYICTMYNCTCTIKCICVSIKRSKNHMTCRIYFCIDSYSKISKYVCMYCILHSVCRYFRQ